MAKELGIPPKPSTPDLSDLPLKTGGGPHTGPATSRPKEWRQRIRSCNDSEILAVQEAWPKSAGGAAWPAPYAAQLVLETLEPEGAVAEATKVFSAYVAGFPGGNAAEQIYNSVVADKDNGVTCAWAFIRRFAGGMDSPDRAFTGSVKQGAGVEFVAQLGVALLAAGLTPEQVATDLISRTSARG